MIVLVVTGISAQQKAGDLKIDPYVFEAASKERVDAEIGRLFVPESRTRSDSRLVELAFVRFKSTNPKPGPPIVYLAGGPGGSGIAAARSARFPIFMAMREIGDVIALDQRGTGISKPSLACRGPIDIAPERVSDRVSINAAFQKASRACAEMLKQQGTDLSGYNANESADDIEDLRKALGVAKVSLWAISYGTHLSLATVKRHEKSIHRMILAGVEGLDGTIKLPSNIQKHLENLDALARQDVELSKRVPSLTALMKEVLDKLEREPVVVDVADPQSRQPVKITVSKFVLQRLTAFRFGSGEAQLPAAYYRMSQGDLSSAATGWLQAVRGSQNLGSAMPYMMDCYSGISPQRRKQIAAEARSTLLGDVMDLPFPDICDAWGNPDLGEAFRQPVKTRIPTLFISGTLDVRTPPSNAEEVRRGFTNSEHLIIDGAVHSDPLFLSSPRIKDVMLEFMRGDKISTTRITLPALKFQPLRPATQPGN
jgi:pimeloyl-ACP methyl ester carboxylesterase